VEAVGVDISPDMLAKARAKLDRCPATVKLIQGDAQTLFVDKASFDAVIFNLILSVIPDGRACLQENLRALKPGGRAVVFDKFLPDDGKLTFGRKLVNFFSTLLGTDITRRFGDMAGGLPCRIRRNEPSLAGGLYRVILLDITSS